MIFFSSPRIARFVSLIFFLITLSELTIKFVIAIYKKGFNTLLVHFVMKMAKGLLLINPKGLSIVK